MAYVSKNGRRPLEYASKSSHTHVITDPEVSQFLKFGSVPKKSQAIDVPEKNLVKFRPVERNPISHIIAVDGGFEEIAVQHEFPSSTICFFQFGALSFSIRDLEMVSGEAFIDPEDMAKLKQIQRVKFTLPVRNFTYKDEPTVTHSVRRAVYDFFNQKIDDEETLMDTLRWFVFQEYGQPLSIWNLASCPHCGQANIPLGRTSMGADFTFHCNHCGKEIFLTDVFRLHEAVDDEMGAGGILGYVTTTFEQMLIVHLIRLILKLKPSLLNTVMFIKDGPLAFFGQTASMQRPMRSLVRYLFENGNLYLAGLEKSGPFVEHADQVAERIEPGTALVLDNDYIYRYIIPGKADPSNPYGRTTYYGNKLIFKSQLGGVHVVTVPTLEVLPSPKVQDLKNLQVILTNIEKLKCDMYDSALMPVALVNKLVSLSQFPSSRILERFAKSTLGGSES